jgi:hypothetical protein
MWRVGLVVELVVFEVVAACGARFPVSPLDEGPAWTELTSEHFTVWTDGDPSRVCELIRRMERLREVTTGVVYPTAPASGRALAIVLRDDEELGTVANTGEPRAFSQSATGPLWQPVVVLSLTSSEHPTVAHELTHLVSFGAIRHQPRWLAEGMATYFESMELDATRTTVKIGVAPSRYRRDARIVPAPELFDWSRMLSRNQEYQLYRTAWALFAFLRNEYPNELAHYLWLIDRVDEPMNGTWRIQHQRAWDQGFPSLPIDQVHAKLEHWLRYGSHMELLFYVHPKESRITARRLGDADVHAIRAVILGGPTAGQASRERGEIEQALAAEPTNVLAWVLKVARGDRPSVAAGRSIAAAHPDDWRAWWLATMALDDGRGDAGELEAARRRACGLLARNRALVAPPRLCPGAQLPPVTADRAALAPPM